MRVSPSSYHRDAPCSAKLDPDNQSFFLNISDSLTFTALTAINVKRRVILTGTPVQVSSVSDSLATKMFDVCPGITDDRLLFAFLE